MSRPESWSGAWDWGQFPEDDADMGDYRLALEQKKAALANAAGPIMTLYLAVEPFVRRVWPTMLVSWSRLLSRTRTTWRDPVIGRSVLAGLVAGVVLLFLEYFSDIVLAALQGGPVRPTRRVRCSGY